MPISRKDFVVELSAVVVAAHGHSIDMMEKLLPQFIGWHMVGFYMSPGRCIINIQDRSGREVTTSVDTCNFLDWYENLDE